VALGMMNVGIANPLPSVIASEKLPNTIKIEVKAVSSPI
jgi:hypothetical protein